VLSPGKKKKKRKEKKGRKTVEKLNLFPKGPLNPFSGRTQQES